MVMAMQVKELVNVRDHTSKIKSRLQEDLVCPGTPDNLREAADSVFESLAVRRRMQGDAHFKVYNASHEETMDVDRFWVLSGQLLDDVPKGAVYEFLGPRGVWVPYPDHVNDAIEVTHNDPASDRCEVDVPAGLLTPSLLMDDETPTKITIMLMEEADTEYWVHQEQSGKQRRVRLHPEVEVSSEQTTLETLRDAMTTIETISQDSHRGATNAFAK